MKKITINVQNETHQRLYALKKENESYDGVITRLLDIDDKYNAQNVVYEYEYVLSDDNTRLFRVNFGERIFVEYYNRSKHEYESNIKAWETMSETELDNFIKFIIKDENLFKLCDMNKELVEDDVMIMRV